jgi:hypothetical protein
MSWRAWAHAALGGGFALDFGSSAGVCIDSDAGCGIGCEPVAHVIARATLGAVKFAFVGSSAESLPTHPNVGFAARLRESRHAADSALQNVGEARAAPGEHP